MCGIFSSGQAQRPVGSLYHFAGKGRKELFAVRRAGKNRKALTWPLLWHKLAAFFFQMNTQMGHAISAKDVIFS
uniref:hypothetical protein n=1 Tax=Candidatus Electronema sp. TaxID=2698783 RepID=UPI004057BE86